MAGCYSELTYELTAFTKNYVIFAIAKVLQDLASYFYVKCKSANNQ